MSEEEIKVGEYCRTKNGFIGKIENINDFRPPESKYAVDIQAEDLVFIGEDFIKKNSPNIIDLIEERRFCWKLRNRIYSQKRKR